MDVALLDVELHGRRIGTCHLGVESPGRRVTWMSSFHKMTPPESSSSKKLQNLAQGGGGGMQLSEIASENPW